MYYYPLSSLRAAYDFHIAPSVRRCEKLIPAARQTKPSAPPSLLCKGLQSGWGRRFRLPGQFFTPSDAWGYVEIVAACSEDNALAVSTSSRKCPATSGGLMCTFAHAPVADAEEIQLIHSLPTSSSSSSS